MSKISFLIPALNEERNIASCIASIRTNTPPSLDYEIIVGDHGSSDKTVALAQAAGASVISFQKGTTIAALRNFLVKNSSGIILIFIDADVNITDEWGTHIREAITDIMANPKQITGSWCSPPAINNPFITCWFGVMPTENRSYLGTGHIIFPRMLYDEIGGFNSELKTGEDYDFCARGQSLAHCKIISNPSLKVIHLDYPLTVHDFVRREKWHGTGDVQSIKNFLQSKIALISLPFILLHVLAVIGLLTNARLLLVALLGIIFVATALSWYKFPTLKRQKRVLNTAIFYFYLVGRSLSLLSRLAASQK